ncbi:hypothetical protein DPM19_25895 [Actinomadura craniellae]|uniref:YNCE-like beta-propeller domain-containing protein n=1 Tax=Actinomadura craniellae TaxID=2231787 RepID=A0A365GZA6_9ACTN|nr:hypothetical protein DPM19_25895 [Actinomadura craniellae]
MGVLTLAALTACRSPAPFYRTGTGGPGAAVVALGGPAPYVAGPPDRTATAEPMERPLDVYAGTRGRLLGGRPYPPMVYVPNAGHATVDVIDQRTYQIVGRLWVGPRPRYVTPSWDGRTLWVSHSGGLTAIDPRNGRRGRRVPLADPRGLYFRPDGGAALVLADGPPRVDFYDPALLRGLGSLRVPCSEPEHADFSADGAQLVIGCPPSGELVRVDPVRRKVTGRLPLGAGSRPQQIRLSPDGRMFYVADAAQGGVWLIDAARFRRAGFVPTGAGAHGLHPGRDGRLLYAAGRDDDSVTLIDFAARRVVGRWWLPPGAAPQVVGMSADGGTLWLSGRGAVHVVSTHTGHLLRTLWTGGAAPYGLAVYPQPGTRSLGPTGHTR